VSGDVRRSLLPPAAGRFPTAAAFQRLADVPSLLEWFANFGGAATRRVYWNALKDFIGLSGIAQLENFGR